MSARWRRISLVIIFVGVVSVVWYRWTVRTGCISYHNYKRIQVGMSREEVTRLLGSRGEVIPTDYVPFVPDYVKLPGAPPGSNRVVWGTLLFRWRVTENERTIYVGFDSNGVTSAWYWELRL